MLPEENVKIYTVTPYSFSVTTPREKKTRTINDLIEEFNENQRLPDLDPNTPPSEKDVRMLDIKVDIASNKGCVTLEQFGEIVKGDQNWRKRWSSNNYYNELIAYAGCDEVATLYLLTNEEESSSDRKVLYWNYKIIKGTEKELNELVYRMNQAQILGPIEVLLK